MPSLIDVVNHVRNVIKIVVDVVTFANVDLGSRLLSRSLIFVDFDLVGRLSTTVGRDDIC